MAIGIVEAAEVGEVERARSYLADASDARMPRFDIDVRRRSRRAHVRGGVETYAADVAGERRAPLHIVEGDVMRGVPRRVQRDESPPAAGELGTVPEGDDAIAGGGREPAPHRGPLGP